MIPVTKPFLPPEVEFKKYIDGIWQRQSLTNMGPLSNELENKLKSHLNVSKLLFVTNGTVALQMAIKALELSGEIITTPFSFVATTSTIVWEGCVPVFVDIDRHSLCIDPLKIECAITEKTSAILATHVYGNPCDVIAIQNIANKYNLKVIYDGAHAFGVNYDGKSIFDYGNITTCSLHATKLYHSIEGGFLVSNDGTLIKKLSRIRNFGISGFETFDELGINGKNSEFHAAMGLVNLNYISNIHEKRKILTEHYDSELKALNAIRPLWNTKATLNYAYYPIILESEELLKKIKDRLEINGIYTRRYFFPSLSSSLPYVKNINLECTDDISRRVLCLPLYYDLSTDDVNKICRLILNI